MQFPRTVIVRRAASWVALVAWAACGGRGDIITPSIDQPGTGQTLILKGLYTFTIQAAPACGWPMTTFAWPVSIQVTSYREGTTVGWIVFPTTALRPFNAWSIHGSPTRTDLVPAEESPGPAAAAYNLVVDGGRWEAGGPTKAYDGRGQITSGTASGARQVLKLPGSDRTWDCRSDAKWNLLARLVDPD